MTESDLIYHTIPPVYSPHSRILMLGSFPSPKSRETAFFYGHPQNRFWRVLAGVFAEPVPATVEEKRQLLLNHRIALWDVLSACTIQNADDASIRNYQPNDLSEILEAADIRAIFTTGGKAHQLYTKLILPKTGMPAIALPSTSPANCRCSLDSLIEAYSVIRQYL